MSHFRGGDFGRLSRPYFLTGFAGLIPGFITVRPVRSVVIMRFHSPSGQPCILRGSEASSGDDTSLTPYVSVREKLASE